MDLKLYYQLHLKYPKLPKVPLDSPYKYDQENIKKLILELKYENDCLKINSYRIDDYDPEKDYKDYLFYSTNLKSKEKYNTQILSLFGFSVVEDKKKKKVKLKDDSKILKIIKKLFDNIEKYLKKDICNKKEYYKILLEKLKNNSNIRILTFELEGKKPNDIIIDNQKLKDIVARDYLSKVLEFKKLNAVCNICGKKKEEFLVKFNYLLEFTTSKEKDPTSLEEDSKPLFICKDCAFKLFEIRDSFYLWEKIKVGQDYLTLLFYEPIYKRGIEFIFNFLLSIYNENKVIRDFNEIKQKIEDLEKHYNYIELKYIETGVIFDILIFSKSRSERIVKKYIPNVQLKDFVKVIKKNNINGKNLLDYKNFKDSIYLEKEESKELKKLKKLIRKYYLEYLASAFKNKENKKLMKQLTYILIHKFKDYNLSKNIMFIKLKDYYQHMSNSLIKEFAYLIGKLAKVYFIEKTKNRSNTIDWAKAKKEFSRKLLTRRYNKLKDLVSMFDYFYSKNAIIEKGIKINDVVEKIKDLDENLKVEDEIVKFYMILAFEEQK